MMTGVPHGTVGAWLAPAYHKPSGPSLRLMSGGVGLRAAPLRCGPQRGLESGDNPRNLAHREAPLQRSGCAGLHVSKKQ